MAVDNAKIKWDQTGFEALKAGWSPLRRIYDYWRLRQVTKLAKDSPTFRQALNWAQSHGVKIYIDRKTQNCAAYYSTGTGVVALGDLSQHTTIELAGDLTHEIRHAWQDYRGLISPDSSGDFSTDFISTSLIEADAEAFGSRVEDEIRAARQKRSGRPLPLELRRSIANELIDLGDRFLAWFRSQKTLQYYGDICSFDNTQYWKMPIHNYQELKDSTDINGEFDIDLPPLGNGIDIAHLDDVLRLGETFSGDNYLAVLPRDTLPRRVLSPALANNFHRAANDDQRKRTAELRKIQLRQKLAPAIARRAAISSSCRP